MVVDAGFGGGWRGVLGVFGFLTRPFAFFGAFVCVFGAVVEAEFPGVGVSMVLYGGRVGLECGMEAMVVVVNLEEQGTYP